MLCILPKFILGSKIYNKLIRKDFYNPENLTKLGLNEMQIKAVMYVKEKGRITLADFKELSPNVSEKTLYRDLQELVNKSILRQIGDKKGRKYELSK
ncbi:MAG TPA: hypothetical protein PKW23_03530 [Dictyoglomaceae bacterium]|nr:hypothetical protein [Dictyoglomaceae bacterium]HOL39421.1 hypothetical protein [Dictyoglomaceae bacterium]HOP95541.1 hypothetical protein [Dictyoglomaceae bacterium]HPP16386.1 hypothetical protein [Dictyoglomaceae bacterium]